MTTAGGRAAQARPPAVVSGYVPGQAQSGPPGQPGTGKGHSPDGTNRTNRTTRTKPRASPAPKPLITQGKATTPTEVKEPLEPHPQTKGHTCDLRGGTTVPPPAGAQRGPETRRGAPAQPGSRTQTGLQGHNERPTPDRIQSTTGTPEAAVRSKPEPPKRVKKPEVLGEPTGQE